VSDEWGFEGEEPPLFDDSWLPADIAISANAPLLGVPGNRTALAYQAVIAQFRVEVHPRYQPTDLNGDGKPEHRCNVFLSDATTALGCKVPRGHVREWWRANRQIDWLSSIEEGGSKFVGWMEVPREVASVKAHFGWPTVAGWHSGSATQSGHVALVVPAPLGETGLWVAQAGASCSSSMPLALAFGTKTPIRFFTHR
jgi:hypothetical protein